MRGWFDAFRHDGGPTLYDRANRTAVTGDVPTITLCVVFITLFVAFLIIFPGVRKERFTTFTSVTLSLFVGAAILVSNYGSEWHTAEQKITSAYRAFSSEKIVATLGVNIGFHHVNVTLRTTSSWNVSDRIDYNEQFGWKGPDDMLEAYELALRKGLPYPILTVAEYLSLNEEGFGWGRIYRNAGYFCGLTLWSAFASWILMNILFLVVPSYGAYMMILTGGLMWLTNLLYYLMTPARPLVMRFEDAIVSFKFGWCFWLVLAGGGLCVLAGFIIAMVEVAFPHKFSTILEVDYDTPYDRHIIIEESHDTKNKRPRLEEPGIGTFGSRIFRRLSKRSSSSGSGSDDPNDPKFGLDNPSMELDPPKSPWRYPHRTFSVAQQQMAQQRPKSRTESRKSTKSVNFRDVNVYGKTLHPSNAAFTPSLEDAADVHPHHSSPETSKSEWDDDSSSGDEPNAIEEEDQVERLEQHSSGNSVTVNFQSQFRPTPPAEDWNEPELPASLPSIMKSALHKSLSAQSAGYSTPNRRVSGEEVDSIQLDRTGSYHGKQRSALATVSARISAAVDADRSRSSGDDDSHRVDLW